MHDENNGEYTRCRAVNEITGKFWLSEEDIAGIELAL